MTDEEATLVVEAGQWVRSHINVHSRRWIIYLNDRRGMTFDEIADDLENKNIVIILEP